LVDMAGYVECIEMIVKEREKRKVSDNKEGPQEWTAQNF